MEREARQTRLYQLLTMLKNDVATEQELAELRDMLYTEEVTAEDWVTNELATINVEEGYDEVLLQSVLARIKHDKETIQRPVHRVHFLQRFKWAAAAVFMLAIAGTWFLVQENKPKQNVMLLGEIKAPEKNRAVIQLSNGQTIYLDSLAAGASLVVDGITLTKTKDGQIIYSGNTDAVAYNTASNPRGSTVMDLELADHTHVWLNAGSSITYPVAFNGNERRVSIDGEAYFEVAHDANKPFIVSKGNTAVRVLGTHFNVKAYTNEASEKITLLEGKVQVNRGGSSQLLAPNQQAIVANETIRLASAVNVDDVIAWKNGYTTFHEADMHEILRELERWYDIKTEVKKEIRTTRLIDVPRSIPLKDMLRALLDEHGIKYEYDAENKKLTILP